LPGKPPRLRPSRRHTTAASSSASQRVPTSEPGLVDAILAEYTALRNEIELLIKDAEQYQTFALGLIAVLPPAFALLLSTKHAWLAIPAIILANSAFCLFGYLFFRCHQEVYIVAAYLKNVVRPKIRELTGSPSVWEWEEYKAKTNLEIQHSSRLGLLGSPRFVWLLRLLVFLLPASIGIAAIGIIVFRVKLVHEYPMSGLIGISLGALVNIGMVVVLSVWFWSKGNLAKVLEDEA
jgi:hypothetical protein